MTIVTDLKKLISEKEKKGFEKNIQPATVTFLFADSLELKGEAEIRPRGEFRREECYMPPVMINFKTGEAGALKKLGRLKFVWPCDNTIYYEQLVLKEYLVYRMYNLLTEKSFRVRLVKVNYTDISGKIKPHKTYGFFIEDVDDMAKRNNCTEVDTEKFFTEQTNRQQATLIALFNYMIGNTDQAVSVYHNIKLIRNRGDSLSLPFIVPYDFDCNGLVDPDYAVPPPELELISVRQRLYRGFSRTMEELQQTLSLLHNSKTGFDSLITGCKPLLKAYKKEMINYVDDFFTIIKEEDNVREIFIKKARKE
ncbi:MAG: hypothetical protein JNN00_17890 [Chitinophagaceae bacterium]|nr:hypothetical protein [Chitinophagaceae bacterium]